jgi:hypothetical protein
MQALMEAYTQVLVEAYTQAQVVGCIQDLEGACILVLEADSTPVPVAECTQAPEAVFTLAHQLKMDIKGHGAHALLVQQKMNGSKIIAPVNSQIQCYMKGDLTNQSTTALRARASKSLRLLEARY